MYLLKGTNPQQLEEKNLDEDDDNSQNDEEVDEASDATGELEVDSSPDDSSSNTSSYDSDDPTSGSADEDEDVANADDELRKQLAAALNMDANGDSGEEEEFMDDEQMLKLDHQLAAVFRMQQGPKSDKKRAESELCHHASFGVRG